MKAWTKIIKALRIYLFPYLVYIFLLIQIKTPIILNLSSFCGHFWNITIHNYTCANIIQFHDKNNFQKILVKYGKHFNEMLEMEISQVASLQI